MTTQEKIEAIQAKCIEANPEIVELKFGCEVIIETRGIKLICVVWRVVNALDGNGVESIKLLHTEQSVIDWDRRAMEIIGRSIRLADVLLATQKEQRLFLDNSSVYRGYWNLHKDDLTQQSEETIDFIVGLLDVK